MGFWMVFGGVVVVLICLSILWLVARGGCDTYAQYDEKAFVSAHSYIYIYAQRPTTSTTSFTAHKIHLNLAEKEKQKNSSQPTPLQSNPPPHRPTFPQKQIYPSIHFTTSPPSAPSSTPSSPPPSSPTPPPSASADPPQTESIHPAYTSQYAYLHH